MEIRICTKQQGFKFNWSITLVSGCLLHRSSELKNTVEPCDSRHHATGLTTEHLCDPECITTVRVDHERLINPLPPPFSSQHDAVFITHFHSNPCPGQRRQTTLRTRTCTLTESRAVVNQSTASATQTTLARNTTNRGYYARRLRISYTLQPPSQPPSQGWSH
jgi:hypothetical protein